MIVCQYCVAENSNLLRGSGFIFFRDMFEKASIGALFIFTETAPRIWPDLCELMEEYCPYMQVAFVRNGRQMLIMKFDCKTNLFMREEDERQRRVFQDMSKDHTRKISSGWERQEQKIRGSVWTISTLSFVLEPIYFKYNNWLDVPLRIIMPAILPLLFAASIGDDALIKMFKALYFILLWRKI